MEAIRHDYPALLSGFQRFLDPSETELREAGAKLNPVVTRQSPGSPATTVYLSTDAPAPTAKTDQFMREAARQSDAASKADVDYDCHPLQQTGVHGSHACMKIPGWDDQRSRSPDPMHTVTNEVKAICGMVKGGSRAMYSVGRLAEVARWEITCNGRWQDVLGPYLAGLCA